MKRLTFFVFLTVIALCGDVYALGIGAYSKSSIGYSSLSRLDYTMGFGLILDTAVAKPTRFNYRLNLGYETYATRSQDFFTEKSWHRVVMNNTFGYALFVNEYFRVWMGPRFSLACQFDVAHAEPDYSFLNPFLISETPSRDVRTYILGITSLGVMVGMNANIGDTVTLSIESGLSGGMSLGIMRRKSYYKCYNYMPPFGPGLIIVPSKASHDELTNGFAEFQVQVSVLCRIGDHGVRMKAAKVESIQR